MVVADRQPTMIQVAQLAQSTNDDPPEHAADRRGTESSTVHQAEEGGEGLAGLVG